VGVTWPLVVVALTVLATTIMFAVSPSSHQLDAQGKATD
jgi:hypothetical protein